MESIAKIFNRQKQFFKSGITQNVDFRIEMLKKLDAAILKWSEQLYDALYKDLHKSKKEAYLTEISIVLSELKLHLKNVKKWSKDRPVASPISIFPSKSRIVYEPLGTSLIVAPWNYPVHLLLHPLIAAISSGCTAILKSSPYTPHVDSVLCNMIADAFNEEYIAMVSGGREVNSFLFSLRFDLVFLTGSPHLGKVAMQECAKNLVPVVLELGGKSPAIISEKADLKIAAKRLAWAKTMNAGQTCVAPDYLLIPKSMKEDFVKYYNQAISLMYGADMYESKHYCRLVSDKAFDRVQSYLNQGNILSGGNYNNENLYIEATILEVNDVTQAVMQEEIFGPILALLTYENLADAVAFIQEREKPLALYFFGDSKEADYVLKNTSSGSACINDALIQLANHNLPFGGVGNSGMGRYHGYESFLTFSNKRSLIVSKKSFDLPFRYMPYKFFNMIKRIL